MFYNCKKNKTHKGVVWQKRKKYEIVQQSYLSSKQKIRDRVLK